MGTFVPIAILIIYHQRRLDFRSFGQVNPNIRKEKWSEAEDDNLTRLFYMYGNAWAEISRNMNGRTDQQCMVSPKTPYSLCRNLQHEVVLTSLGAMNV